MLTLDEAIKHCEEKAKELKKDYERAVALNIPSEGCLECANEHEQLAGWLTELQERRKAEELYNQAAVEYTEYCERYEPTYNPDDGSM